MTIKTILTGFLATALLTTSSFSFAEVTEEDACSELNKLIITQYERDIKSLKRKLKLEQERYENMKKEWEASLLKNTEMSSTIFKMATNAEISKNREEALEKLPNEIQMFLLNSL